MFVLDTEFSFYWQWSSPFAVADHNQTIHLDGTCTCCGKPNDRLKDDHLAYISLSLLKWVICVCVLIRVEDKRLSFEPIERNNICRRRRRGRSGWTWAIKTINMDEDEWWWWEAISFGNWTTWGEVRMETKRCTGRKATPKTCLNIQRESMGSCLWSLRGHNWMASIKVHYFCRMGWNIVNSYHWCFCYCSFFLFALFTCSRSHLLSLSLSLSHLRLFNPITFTFDRPSSSGWHPNHSILSADLPALDHI